MRSTGRRKAGSYSVNIPTWKIAELAGLTSRSVQVAMKLGELDHSIESVFAWLRKREP